MTLRIGVITSDAPVSEDRPAWGMHHVNARLLKALGPSLELAIVVNACPEDIDPLLRRKCYCVHSPRVLRAVRKVVAMMLGAQVAGLGFRLALPRLARRLRETGAQWLFCPCGGNAFDLERAVLLSKASGLPLAVYLVDDLLESAQRSGCRDHQRVAKDSVPGWLAGAAKIFVISQGFRDRLRALYGLEAEVLPLPYGLPLRARPVAAAHGTEIIFAGNINYLYAAGLKAMARVLDEINTDRGTPITLRLTLADIHDVKKMIGDFRCIRCAPCTGEGDLQAAIASSLMAFVPYSFDPADKLMTGTSFPSKILLSLASSRHVLVYGPPDSSLVRYFRAHALPEVIDREDAGLLREAVLAQERSVADHAVVYQRVVHQEHEPSRVAAQLLAGLTTGEDHGA